MSTNCLITKLKGVVDNENLRVFGHCSIPISTVSSFNASNSYIILDSNTEDVVVTIKNGEGTLYLSNGGEAITLPYTIPANSGGKTFWYSNGNYEIDFSSMYSLTKFGVNGNGVVFDSSSLAYMKNIEAITNAKRITGELPINMPNVARIISSQDVDIISGAKISLDILKTYPKIRVISSDGENAYGDIGLFTLDNFPNLKEVVIGNQGNSSIQLTGSIDNINIPLTTFMINSTRIEGSIEAFVATQRKSVAEGGAGRSSYNFNNELRFLTHGTIVGNGITFQGEQIPRNKNVNLSWTENTITFEGVTINA